MRVASSDWWASRMVVSVTSARFSARIQRAKASGPSRVEPLLGAGRRLDAEDGAGTTSAACFGRRTRPRVSGWPLTVTSAM